MLKGHKPGCQCIICKRLRAKVEREGKIATVVPEVGVTIGSLAIGTKFRYQNAVYQKINDLSGDVSLITDLTTAGEATTMTLPNSTKVELFKRTHIEDSMD